MQALNLPPAKLKLTQQDNATYVFDTLRQKYIRLTPEEWVRQHFVHFLIEQRGYPRELLANEVSLSLNGTTKRCDTVLYDKQVRPLMIVEYKAPHIQINQKTFNQISRYNIVLRVPFLIISNGLQHYCCQVNYSQQTYEFLQEIPFYKDL